MGNCSNPKNDKQSTNTIKPAKYVFNPPDINSLKINNN